MRLQCSNSAAEVPLEHVFAKVASCEEKCQFGEHATELHALGASKSCDEAGLPAVPSVPKTPRGPFGSFQTAPGAGGERIPNMSSTSWGSLSLPSATIPPCPPCSA